MLEQGINVLYVAFGLLDWAESPDSDVRIQSPLILVPVKLDRETALEPYTLAPLDEGAVINPALAFKLDRDFALGLSLPDDGDEDTSLAAMLSHLRSLVAGRKDWVVREDVVLGLFSFAKHAMYADLATNLARFARHNVIRALAGEANDSSQPGVELPTAESLDDDVKPSAVYQVVDADATQQEAIAQPSTIRD